MSCKNSGLNSRTSQIHYDPNIPYFPQMNVPQNQYTERMSILMFKDKLIHKLPWWSFLFSLGARLIFLESVSQTIFINRVFMFTFLMHLLFCYSISFSITIAPVYLRNENGKILTTQIFVLMYVWYLFGNLSGWSG